MKKVEDIFRQDGPLVKILKGYKPRPGQISLAKLVYGSLDDGRHLIAEAGTGVGKSLAYSIPSALHVLDPDGAVKRVVIATSSIVLQEQLIKKDLPTVREVMKQVVDRDLRFLLVKGFSNYMCLDAVEESKREGKFIPADLVDWIARTKTGDRSELHREPSDAEWSLVSKSKEECAGSRCDHFEKCFAFAARRADPLPHIIVTNYHILFFDFLMKGWGQTSILPEYDAVIMDEAHKAVEIAMDFQGFEYGVGSIHRLANKIGKADIKGGAEAAEMLRRSGDHFFDRLKDQEVRSATSFLRQPLGYSEQLVEALKAASSVVERASDREAQDAKKAKLEKLSTVLSIRSGEFRQLCYGIGETNELPEGRVYYLTDDRFGTKVHCKDVEVTEFFNEHLFNHYTAIATSATLTTGGNFKFVAGAMGLDDSEYEGFIAPTPFDPERVMFLIPNDIPEPKPVNKQQHADRVSELVVKVVQKLGGRTMALFTSYSNLSVAAKKATNSLHGINILVQGEKPKSRIIQEFKDNPNSLILATASFWEGVDIPGKALTCVIIDKVPFVPPDDPVMWYLTQLCEREGRSGVEAFMDYSVPKATIALKQGIGRLIRTEEDYGVVFLCDRRVVIKGYGGEVLSARPHSGERECWMDPSKSTDGCIEVMSNFIEDLGG